jgi:hypothetical protein
VKRSLREVLAVSHVAAVAIAILALGGLFVAFQALMGLLVYLVVNFVFTVVAMLGGPHNSFAAVSLGYWHAATALWQAAICLLAAFLLSRFVFGKNPLRMLRDYWVKVRKRFNA